MVVAAEALEQALEFDWEFVEDQFSEATSYVRPAESEIYGRSLSTVYRFGVFMVGASLESAINSPEAAQAKVEFYTSVEEGFGTDEELGGGLEVRDFDKRPVIDGKVMAKDNKTAISDMTEAGLNCALEKAKQEAAQGDCRFVPQLTRSKWDNKNALTVDKMARGETDYNTIIVTSPYVEEAAAQSGNEYWRDIGYVPQRRRGFVQLYHATGDGFVTTGSLSFDGSDKYKLREIFSRFGQEIPEDEVTDNWLKYPITGTFSEDKAKALATEIADMAEDPKYKTGRDRGEAGQEETTNTVDVTKQHKLIMERVFNESYVHICESLARGYQTPGAKTLIFQLADKAHQFNEHYAGALYRMRNNDRQFTDDDSIALHELLVYSTIEMMRALHLQETAFLHGPDYEEHDGAQLSPGYLYEVDSVSFQRMLGGFGAEGATHNRVYSACGLSISLGEENERKNPQSAYGGVDGNSAAELEANSLENYRFDKKMYCVVCQPEPKKGDIKKMCGPCGICRSCDTHLKKSNKG